MNGGASDAMVEEECIPLWLMLCKDLSLGVIADDFDVDEAAQVQLLGPEHRHLEYGSCAILNVVNLNDERGLLLVLK